MFAASGFLKRMRLWVPLALVFAISCAVYAGEPDRIAVAADGRAESSEVSRAAARSPHFLIFDEDGRLLEAVDNPYRDAARRAGPSVARFLADKGVEIVAAGEFGGRMSQALKGEGIEFLEFRGSAAEAVEKIIGAGK